MESGWYFDHMEIGMASLVNQLLVDLWTAEYNWNEHRIPSRNSRTSRTWASSLMPWDSTERSDFRTMFATHHWSDKQVSYCGCSYRNSEACPTEQARNTTRCNKIPVYRESLVLEYYTPCTSAIRSKSQVNRSGELHRVKRMFSPSNTDSINHSGARWDIVDGSKKIVIKMVQKNLVYWRWKKINDTINVQKRCFVRKPAV